MAAQRCKTSLKVLKNISRMSATNEGNIFQHKRRYLVSPSGHVMFYLLDYKQQRNTKPFHFSLQKALLLCNHSNGDLFMCEDNMLYSRAKICESSSGMSIYFYL